MAFAKSKNLSFQMATLSPKPYLTLVKGFFSPPNAKNGQFSNKRPVKCLTHANEPSILLLE